MTNDDPNDIIEQIKQMNKEELNAMNVAYLSFSSKFIEYVREVDPTTFKRALNYAATVVDTTIEN